MLQLIRLVLGESSGRKKRSTLGDLGEIADTVVGYTGSILGLENGKFLVFRCSLLMLLIVLLELNKSYL